MVRFRRRVRVVLVISEVVVCGTRRVLPVIGDWSSLVVCLEAISMVRVG